MSSPDDVPPNVLVLARSLPMHALGGMEAATWDLARALAGSGCGVRVITTACPGRSSGWVEGVDVRLLDAPSAAYSAAWARASVEAFERDHAAWADVALSVSAAGFPLAAHLAGRRRRPPLLMQAHGTSWLELQSKFRTANPVNWIKALANVRGLLWDLASYRLFDEIIAIGPAVARDMARGPTRALLRGAPVQQIDNGVDERFFAFSQEGRARARARHGVPDGAEVVVTTARLHPQKGVAQALAAFAVLLQRRPNTHYIVVGDGPARAELQAQAAHLGGRVHFAGAVGREQVAEYLSAGDLFLFTTLRKEGLPLNLLEAFAAGLPSVLSDHVNAPHFPAVSVKPTDARAVADAIERLLSAAKTQGRPSTLPERHSLAFAATAYRAAFEQQLRARAITTGAVDP